MVRSTTLKTKLIIPILMMILMLPSILSAQTGSLKGRVFDKNTDEPLIGANVIFEGTSLGAASDFDGDYLVRGIPVGNYTLKVSYIGYISISEAVEIVQNRTLDFDFYLEPQTLSGETVVITAQALGQKQAINQQLTSNTIVNVVSSEKIHQLPDDNAAAALSRLPGVSLMNGDQVVIRGVQAKLNQVLVNGIQMPSTGMNDRATNLGFISSNMLSGIEVIKALTPDMDANTIGGVVNLRLREAPSDIHFDVLTQGNYNSTDRTAGNYKVWASVSNRFFDDKLGVFIQGNADRSDGGNQRANLGVEIDASGSLEYGQAVYRTSTADFEYHRSIVDNNGGSLILDYKLPNGKIVLQNTYAANFTDQRNNINRLHFTDTDVLYTIDRNKFGKDLWINALQAENLFGNVKVETGISHSYTSQYTRFAYQSGTWTEFTNMSPVKHPFGVNALGNPITYNSGDAQRNMTMLQAFSIFDNLDPSDADSSTLEGWVSSIANTFKQHLYNTSLDITVPVNFSNSISAIFKAGGKYARTTRENDFDRNFTGASDEDTYRNVQNYFPGVINKSDKRLRLSQVLDTDFDRGKYFLTDEYDFKNGFRYVINTDIYDDWLKTSQSGWSPVLKQDDSWKDDWKGSESFTAGYLMGTFNIYQKLTLIGGVRYERYNMNYNANFTFVQHSVYGDAISTAVGTISDLPEDMYNVNRSDINYFPSLHLRYKPNDWSDIRIAYTTGIARPDYLSIIPKIVVFPGNNYEIGNPKLKPTTVQNIDIIVSFYNNEIGLFTINGFYKKLKDVMYTTGIYFGNASMYADNVFIPDAGFLLDRFSYRTRAQDIVNTSLNNPNPAYVKGIEVDWQTNFWYLPQPLNSIVLDINYTKSWSDIDYRIIRNQPRQVPDPVRPGRFMTVYTSTDTVFSDRLVQQADDVLNVALGIDYKGFSGRISFNMRGDVLNSVGIRPEETSFTGNIYRWDFTLKQNLPLDGLSLSLSGVNIFHNPIRSYRRYRVNANAPITENLITVLYSPTIYQLNLRYSF